MLDRIAELRAAGLDVRAQVAARGVGGIVGLRTTTNPFAFTPGWKEIADKPLAERLAQLHDPAFRARLLYELTQPSDHPWAMALANCYGNLFRMSDPVDYEPHPDSSIAAEAKRAGREPAEYCYDVLLEQDGERLLYMPTVNYAHGSLDDVHTMMTTDFALFGLSDGGAHCEGRGCGDGSLRYRRRWPSARLYRRCL